MQAAALQRQLVLKSCRPQLCKGNWCSSHAGRSFAKAIGAQVMQAAALQRQLVLKSCRPQLCKGNWCSSHAGRSFAKAIGAQVMQAAALQRQLVLKSYNWPWWSTCRSQLTVSNSPQIYCCHISVWKGIIYLYIYIYIYIYIYSAKLGFTPSGHLSS